MQFQRDAWAKSVMLAERSQHDCAESGPPSPREFSKPGASSFAAILIEAEVASFHPFVVRALAGLGIWTGQSRDCLELEMRFAAWLHSQL